MIYMRYLKEGIGELIGTFFLVLFGCGSVAVAFCFDEYHGIFQTGIVWGDRCVPGHLCHPQHLQRAL